EGAREAAPLLHGYGLPSTLGSTSRTRHALKLLQPVLQIIERLPQYRELLFQQRQALRGLLNPARCWDRDGETDGPPARNTADRSGLAMTSPAFLIVSLKETVCRSDAVYRQLRPRARFSISSG